MAKVKKIKDEEAKIKVISSESEHKHESELEHAVAQDEVADFAQTVTRGSRNEFDTTLHESGAPQRARQGVQAEQPRRNQDNEFRGYEQRGNYSASQLAGGRNEYNTTLEGGGQRQLTLQSLQPTHSIMQTQGVLQHSDLQRKRISHGINGAPSDDGRSLDDISSERKKRYAWEA